MTEKSMMLVQATWQDKQTFRSLQMLPKLDEYGQPVAGSKGQREERHKLDVFQEFYIEDKIAVKDLIHLFAINAKTFDYGAFMSEKEEELPVAGV